MPAGAPTEYTDELALEISQRIAEGQKTTRVMRDLGFNPSTLFDWLHRYPEFANMYARAKEIAMEIMGDEILNIADDSRDDKRIIESETGDVIELTDHDVINRSRLRVDTRKWLMSKLAPKKFGDRQNIELTGKDGGPLTAVIRDKD